MIVEANTVEEVLENINKSNLTLLDFYGNFCMPCLRLMTLLPKISEHFGEVLQIVKIDVEKLAEYSHDNGIKAVPSFKIYRNGTLLEEWTGVKPILEIKRILDGHLTDDEQSAILTSHNCI